MSTTAETAIARRKPWFDLMQSSHAHPQPQDHTRQGMRTVVFTLPAHVFDALWAESIATQSSIGVLMAERLAQSLRDDDLLCICGVCGAPIKDGEPRVILWEGTACTTCAECGDIDVAGVRADAAMPGTDAAVCHTVGPSESSTCWNCAQDCGTCATEDGV